MTTTPTDPKPDVNSIEALQEKTRQASLGVAEEVRADGYDKRVAMPGNRVSHYRDSVGAPGSAATAVVFVRFTSQEQGGGLPAARNAIDDVLGKGRIAWFDEDRLHVTLIALRMQV